jgi:hydrogenase nickel incorporation protein HypB
MHAEGAVLARRVRVEQDLLAKNNAYAAQNRRFFLERAMLVLNVVSSPGSGKTTLLTHTIAALGGEVSIAVIEGDQQTSRDAERIRAAGAPAVQINTGKGSHWPSAGCCSSKTWAILCVPRPSISGKRTRSPFSP